MRRLLAETTTELSPPHFMPAAFAARGDSNRTTRVSTDHLRPCRAQPGGSGHEIRMSWRITSGVAGFRCVVPAGLTGAGILALDEGASYLVVRSFNPSQDLAHSAVAHLNRVVRPPFRGLGGVSAGDAFPGAGGGFGAETPAGLALVPVNPFGDGVFPAVGTGQCSALLLLHF